MIVVQLVIAQPVVPTEIVTHVQVHVHLQIAGSAVTVHVIHDQVPIVRHVHTEIAQSVVTIVVQVPIVQRVVHTVTAILVRAHVQLQIVHAEIIHSVAIVQRQAMIVVPQVAPTVHEMIDHHAMIAAVHVTANAAVVQIVPEVVLRMIAKNVHAVALAKSA
jgi:hypothetical protein